MSKQDKHEWRLTTWPDAHQCEKHYVDGEYVGEWREVAAPNKAQHSPLPWRTVVETDFEPCSIYADPEQHVADIYGNDKRQRATNAKLIVASVNHADKLAEALRDCITTPGALAERSHEYTLRRLASITADAREAIAAYEAAQ